jgi:hypothetical protein
MINQADAMFLLMQCTGRDIWSVEICREKRIPENWIVELADCFESGFANQRQSIFYDNQLVNQFHGVFDRDLAIKLAAQIGIDVAETIAMAASPEQEVAALQEAAIEQ